jgi:hypothetical protein
MNKFTLNEEEWVEPNADDEEWELINWNEYD